MFLVAFLFITGLANLWFPDAPHLGQHLVSVFNVYHTCTNCLLYFITRYESIVPITTLAVLHYFYFDTLYILTRARDQWPYIIHHVLSIYIGTQFTCTNIPPHAMIPYIFNIELSNTVLTFYTYYNNTPKLLLPMCLTYVPLRTFALTYTTYQMYKSTHDPILHSSYMALLLMSYIYSAHLLLQNKKKLTNTCADLPPSASIPRRVLPDKLRVGSLRF